MRLSAKAIEVCMVFLDPMISYVNIHLMSSRALPDSMMLFKLSIQLYKLYNAKEHSLEWISLNFNQILTSRQTTFSILKTNNRKVGINVLTNCFSVLNGKIGLDWLNNTLDLFKVKC